MANNVLGIMYNLVPQSLSWQFMLSRPAQLRRTIVRSLSGKFMLLEALLVLRHIAILHRIVLLVLYARGHLAAKCCLCFCRARCGALLLSSSVCPECEAGDGDYDKCYADTDSGICTW